MLAQIALWGLVIGIIHFVAVGALYQNPWVARLYTDAQDHPGMRRWSSQKTYITAMFLGTQVEVFILTAGYLYLRPFFPGPASATTALILGALFAGIRVYPRFWNMWIQSSYPRRLLAVELVNGTASTFVVVLGLYLLPVG